MNELVRVDRYLFSENNESWTANHKQLEWSTIEQHRVLLAVVSDPRDQEKIKG